MNLRNKKALFFFQAIISVRNDFRYEKRSNLVYLGNKTKH